LNHKLKYRLKIEFDPLAEEIIVLELISKTMMIYFNFPRGCETQ